MAHSSFRFLHSGDFRLDQPLAGLAEVPEHLEPLLIDAAYAAAETVFRSAVSEAVDFVVLVGDLLDIDRAGPRPLAFLAENFKQLAERKIPIYWATGAHDPKLESWPRDLLPLAGVTVFPSTEPATHMVQRSGSTLAAVTGVGFDGRGNVRAERFRGTNAAPYKIAAVHGDFSREDVRRLPIDYWALGGEPVRSAPVKSPMRAIYPGSPQLRDLRLKEASSCTLVTVDNERRTRLQTIDTDAVRCFEEPLAIEADAKPEAVEEKLIERTQALVAAHGERTLLVRWRLSAPSQLAWRLRRGGWGESLLSRLRGQFGHRNPPVWTLGIDVAPTKQFPAGWYEEDTILGDFLRAVRTLRENPKAPLDLRDYLPAAGADAEILKALQPPDGEKRSELLDTAATLGVDLLRGEYAEAHDLGEPLR